MHFLLCDMVVWQLSEILYSCKYNRTLTFPHYHASALECGTSSGLFGPLSSPIGLMRHHISYDVHMDVPMNSPPPDLAVNILWKDPVVPQHRFRDTTEVISVCFYCLTQILNKLLDNTVFIGYSVKVDLEGFLWDWFHLLAHLLCNCKFILVKYTFATRNLRVMAGPWVMKQLRQSSLLCPWWKPKPRL